MWKKTDGRTAVKKNESDFRLLLNAVKGPALVVENGKILMANREGESLFPLAEKLDGSIVQALQEGVYAAAGVTVRGARWDMAATPLSRGHLLVFSRPATDRLTDGMQAVACAMQEPVNTLATSLEAVGESLRDRDGELDRSFAYALRSQYALMRILRSVGDAASLEDGDAALDLSCVYLDDLCREVCGECAGLTELCGVTLRCELGAQAVATAADRYKLRRMLMHLLSNALAACGEGDTITLGFSVDHGAAVLTVEDTGSGIPADVLSTVFYRAGEKTLPDAREKGIGLGLRFVKAVAEKHDGRVVLTRGREGGTRVTVSLPIKNGSSLPLASPRVERYGGFSDALVELSPVLPPEAYGPDRA